MRTKFKPWALPFLKEHSDISFENLSSIKDDFLENINIEIGGGKGDFVVGLAEKFPNEKFLMIEKVISVAAPAVKKIIETKLDNVRVIFNDFSNIVLNFKNKSVKNIYLNFSDPWPKKRHAKRRLTSEIFFNDYARILMKGGMIIFKTDQFNLYQFTKTKIDPNVFELVYDNNNYSVLDEDDVMTEYEKKFRNDKKIIYRLKLKRL